MIIKTYDPITLKEKETVSNLTSVIYNKRFYREGSFEIHTDVNKFDLNDIIAYKSHGEIRSGIVLKIHETDTDIAVTGYDLKALYGFRYITNPQTYSGTPDEIIKAMVTEFLLTDERAVAGLTISDETVSGSGIEFTPESGFLSDMMELIGITHEIGTAVDFDISGSILFKTLKGTDKSSLVKFGRKFRNIESIEYTRDLFNTYNVGYSVEKVKSTDENGDETETEKETVTGNQTGILRRECYQSKNINEYLAEKAPVETLRAEANEKYQYGVDFGLGDYVTVIMNGTETIKQITEIKEVFENNQNIIIPIFGTEKENPIRKILKGG